MLKPPTPERQKERERERESDRRKERERERKRRERREEERREEERNVPAGARHTEAPLAVSLYIQKLPIVRLWRWLICYREMLRGPLVFF